MRAGRRKFALQLLLRKSCSDKECLPFYTTRLQCPRSSWFSPVQSLNDLLLDAWQASSSTRVARWLPASTAMPTYDDQLRSANWNAKMIPTAYLGVETIIHGNSDSNGKQQRETASPRLVLLMIQTGSRSWPPTSTSEVSLQQKSSGSQAKFAREVPFWLQAS